MKPINEQFKPELLIGAKKLSYFNQLLRNILPIECHDHVAVANVRNRNLMLITDSPVWTTRLRQLSPQILQFIRSNTAGSDNEQIHHVQISTRYQMSTSGPQPAEKKNKAKIQISEKTASILSQSADSIQHQPLKTALLKIARHAGHNRSDKNK